MSNIVHTDPATGLPVGTVAVFLTFGAALVALYRRSDAEAHYDFSWTCLGCGYGPDYTEHRIHARDKANAHAAECRAIPLPRTNQL